MCNQIISNVIIIVIIIDIFVCYSCYLSHGPFSHLSKLGALILIEIYVGHNQLPDLIVQNLALLFLY
jgi:uncharacterized membrane protein YobD (UPF0266 family)